MDPRVAMGAGPNFVQEKNGGCSVSACCEYSGFEWGGLQDIDSAMEFYQGSMDGRPYGTLMFLEDLPSAEALG